jgi:hypothetical protein
MFNSLLNRIRTKYDEHPSASQNFFAILKNLKRNKSYQLKMNHNCRIIL